MSEGGSGSTLAGRSVLTATGIIGVGSLATLAISVLTAKAYAMLVGPSGVGLLGLMQSLVMISALLAGLGLNTALVRAISQARTLDERAAIAAYTMAGRMLAWAAGLLCGVIIVALRRPIATLVLGSPAADDAVVILAPAVVCSVAASIEIALLTAAGRIRAVTAVHVFTYVVAAVAGIGLVGAMGIDGLAPGILITASAQVAASYLINGTRGGLVVSRSDISMRARSLLSVGGWVVASQLANVGVQLAVPIMVLQALTTDDVGFYRASATISIGYLGFFLSSLTYDYLPRAAGAKDGGAVRELIERRMRLVTAIAMPLILFLLAFGDQALSTLYSPEFKPAVSVLSWHLVGDMLRLPAWVLSFALLARAPGRTYVGLEILVGGVLLLTTVGGLVLIGLEGTGIAYAVTQAVYLLVAWILVGRLIESAPGRLQLVILGVCVATAALLVIDIAPAIRAGLFAIAGVVVAGVAWPRLLRLHRTQLL